MRYKHGVTIRKATKRGLHKNRLSYTQTPTLALTDSIATYTRHSPDFAPVWHDALLSEVRRQDFFHGKLYRTYNLYLRDTLRARFKKATGYDGWIAMSDRLPQHGEIFEAITMDRVVHIVKRLALDDWRLRRKSACHFVTVPGDKLFSSYQSLVYWRPLSTN